MHSTNQGNEAMTGSSTNSASKEVPQNNHHTIANDERTLLHSDRFESEPTPDNEVLEQLENLKLNPEDLSQILAEAIAKRPIPDKELAEALRPAIEDAIYTSVRTDVNILATAIFPAIGSGIRKAVVTAIEEMTQSLNQTLEYSFSNQSLKWRMEALLTGRPFAEIVLLRTLLYRVEQVFLIDKETGIVLQHVVAATAAAEDADLVAAMLTAIRDFVKDSFQVHNDDSLDALHFGELTLWIEQGPQAILAGVIRGNAPKTLRLDFQDALARIHLEQSSAFEAFDGDTTPFAASQPILETCLQAQYQVKKQKPSPLVWLVLGTAGVGLAGWVGLAIANNLRWATFLEKLDAEPGIVLTKVEKRGDKYFVRGMRDPLAANPTQLLQAAHVNPKSVSAQWDSYLSLEPAMLSARARQFLKAPDTVSLKADKNGILHATGSAPHQWIVEARQRVQLVPGITQFQDEKLIDADLRRLETSLAQLEKQIIRFAEGTTQLLPGQDDTLAQLAREIEQLLDSAPSLNKDVRIKMVGHTDESGTFQTNMMLSKERADVVLSSLVAKGLDSTLFEVVGVGPLQPLHNEFGLQEPAINRSVSFKVTITDK